MEIEFDGCRRSEGTLAGKTSTSKRYIWVNKYDQTFSATFSDTNDGKTSIISLR